MKKCPRMVIAAPQSGSGKTTVTLAVMKLLTEKGYQVQGFKVGPDYIDTSYYKSITFRPGRNLDAWMTSPSLVKEFFQWGATGADISIIEGVMGLFDGFSGDDDRGSTAHVARVLKAPLVLVVDAKSQARSVAALLYGFYHFDRELDIKGVIFNRVGSESHFAYLKEAVISSGLPVEIIGYFPRDERIEIPERHLGLTPYEEQLEAGETENYFKVLSELSQSYIDEKKLSSIAGAAPEMAEQPNEFFKVFFKPKKDRIPVAIAQDKAFSFYYQENLEWLEKQGAKLIPVSPLKDKMLPPGVKSFYIGGGFPELFAKQLEENEEFKDSVRAFAARGMPVLAECGGLVYLCESVIDLHGVEYKQVGLIPARVKMTEKLKALGYREGKAKRDSFMLKKGESIKGHEFRYSEMFPTTEQFPWAYELKGRFGVKSEGFVNNNILASYFHVHFASNPRAACRWIKAIAGS